MYLAPGVVWAEVSQVRDGRVSLSVHEVPGEEVVEHAHELPQVDIRNPGVAPDDEHVLVIVLCGGVAEENPSER